MIYHCNSCGYETEFEDNDEARDENWWQDDDGEWYCPDCHGSCVHCDYEYPNSELEYSELLEGSVCQGCMEESTSRCAFCEQLDYDDNMITVELADGNRVEICDRCFRNRRNNGLIIERNGAFFMRDENQRNGYTTQINLHPEVWDEINTCPDCSGEQQKCSRCLKKMAKEVEEEETNLWVYDDLARSYHHQVHGHFKSTKLRQKHEHPFLYYGVELECLFRSNDPIEQIAKEFINATGGLFIAEFDRSVSDAGNGIEFISRPLSYKKWMEESTYQYLQAGKAILQKYKAYDPQPDCCGLHVHMSLQFFERNTKKSVKQIKSDIDWIFQIYQAEIEKISQRKYTKYCASKAFRLKQVFQGARMSNYAFNLNPKIELRKGEITMSAGSGDTHHDAIIQTYKTIEVRTFKSTIQMEELLATIEFCRCIAHAARNKELTNKTTLGDIIWCKDSKYLPAFIKRMKINEEKKFENKLEVKI